VLLLRERTLRKALPPLFSLPRSAVRHVSFFFLSTISLFLFFFLATGERRRWLFSLPPLFLFFLGGGGPSPPSFFFSFLSPAQLRVFPPCTRVRERVGALPSFLSSLTLRRAARRKRLSFPSFFSFSPPLSEGLRSRCFFLLSKGNR